MSAAAAFFKPSKQGDWYKAGGSKYRKVPDLIDRLPRPLRHRATEGWKCIMRLLAKRELDPMNATNPAMCEDTGYGETFIKGSIKILKEPYELVETADGDFERVELPPMIVVERKHGRRKISPGIGLARKGEDPKPDPKPAPLCTPPPEKREDQETTTTREDRSSSSLASLPGTAPDRMDGPSGPELPAEVEGAIGLVPGLSREQLVGWVRLAGAELACRVVAWLRVWLCHPDPDSRPGAKGNPVQWAEKALLGWKHKLERGELTMADVNVLIEAKRRKWDRRAAGAKAEAEKQARAKAAAEAAADDRAKQERLRRAWGLLSEPEREEIRRAVDAANPGMRRQLPALMLEGLDLAELEKRQAAELPRAP